MPTLRFSRASTPRNRFAAVLPALLVLGAISCASPAAEDPLEVRVRWGLGETTALPADVAEIEITTCVSDGQTEQCDPTTCSVAALTLTRALGPVETCRPAEGTEMFGMNPVLVRRGFEPGTSVRFLFRGRDAGGVDLYVGQAGPFVLGDGERRFQEVQMYPLGEALPAPGSNVARVLHTATYLPDGRILVAGGFTGFDPTACPAGLGFPSEANCFALTATSQAVAFDVASRTLEPIRSSMLAARGGHTATALPDGRVLIAGGASRAVAAMIPQGAGAVSGYRMEIVPLDDTGAVAAHDHYEVFDAYLGSDPVDADRDGDLGRGTFLGIGGTASPGPLNVPRFLHAAAAVGASPGRVVLAGGLGSADSAATYEVFDADRTGGYGVYQGGGDLGVPRAMPSAVAVGDSQVWIFGGGPVADERGLADVWQLDSTDPNGSVAPASALGEFPQSAPAGTEEHPDYALLRPAVGTVDRGQRALVVGWYGPLCAAEGETPMYDGTDAVQVCNSPPSGSTRSFTVAAATGLTAPTAARLHAFGSAARLFPFYVPPDDPNPPFGLAVTGGVANRLWSPQAAIDVFSGAVDTGGAAIQLMIPGANLSSQRLFHTSVGVPGYGVVTLGGFTFSTASLDRVVFVDQVEVLFLDL